MSPTQRGELVPTVGTATGKVARFRAGVGVCGVLFMAGILGSFTFYSVQWLCAPSLEQAPLIVDYTVPFTDYREHKGLIWALNQAKIRAPNGGRWRVTDYVGYRPATAGRRATQARLGALPSSGAGVLYFADTYGVYHDDLGGLQQARTHSDYSRLVFGSLDRADVEFAQAFAASGRPLVVEFNSLCQPTGPGPRAAMQALLGIEWSGWIARAFENLGDQADVPTWLTRAYTQQYGRQPPQQPALVFVHTDGSILVHPGSDFDTLIPRLRWTAEGQRRYGTDEGDFAYVYWFSIIRAKPNVVVDAELRLPSVLLGTALAKRVGLGGLQVPAMTRWHVQHDRIYFAGDFSDIDFEPPPPGLAGLWAQKLAHLGLGVGDSQAAFFGFFVPVIRKLFEIWQTPVHESAPGHHSD